MTRCIEGEHKRSIWTSLPSLHHHSGSSRPTLMSGHIKISALTRLTRGLPIGLPATKAGKRLDVGTEADGTAAHRKATRQHELHPTASLRWFDSNTARATTMAK